MQTTIDMRTSGQLDPKCVTINPNRNKTIPFIINGCRVSFSSSLENTDEPIRNVKEILLSAYRTGIASR
jgi:hypothetical protein